MLRRLCGLLPLLGVLFIMVACGGNDDEASPTAPDEGQASVDRVEVTPTADTLIAIGESQEFKATALTADGDTVSGVSPSWSSTNDQVAAVNDQGLAQAKSNGSAEIQASVDGTTGSATLIVRQQVASVSVSPSSATLATLGDTIRFSATAADENGHSVSGTTFNWQSATDSVATIDATGLATAQDNGETTITASAEGVAAQATLSVNQVADRLGFRSEPTSTTAGDTLDPAVQVAVLDSAGNVVEGATSSVSLSIGTNPDGGNLSGNTTVDAVDGVATFHGLWIEEAASGYTLQASVSGDIEPATSQSFSITAATADHLAVATQPTDVTAGESISPAVDVEVRDAYGNLVTSSSATVNVTLDSNPGSASLNGTTTVAASNGVATFSDLNIEVAEAGYTLLTSSDGLESSVSDSFKVAPAAPAALDFQTGPSTVKGQEPISPAVEVEILDAYGNLVTSSDTSVTVSLANDPTTQDASGGGTRLSGTTTVQASSGIATFSDLYLSRPGVGFKLEAVASGITTATSGGFDVSLTFEQVSSGLAHSCGVTAANHVFCWGGNADGQLGDGTTTERSRPIGVKGGYEFAQVSAGHTHTCAITTADELFCWGFNGNGELGDGTTTARSTPVAVDVSELSTQTFKQVAAGRDHTCGLTTTDKPYCWGSNGAGQIGDGTTSARLAPESVDVSGMSTTTFSHVSAGKYHSCGITTGSEAYCWGDNGYGSLGDGSTTDRLTPVAVDVSSLSTETFARVSAGARHTCGVTTADKPYCWGLNGSGQIGDGTTTRDSFPSPVDVSGLPTSNFDWVSTGHGYSCGVTTADEPYCWGSNGNGKLGDGTTTDRLTPVAVDVTGLSSQTFSLVTLGQHHTCGLATGGQAYCWGGNYTSELGNGTTTDSLTPVPVIQ